MNKTRADIEQEIKELQEKLVQIDARRAEMGEDNWAADQFHSMTCRQDHTDRCGYEYEKTDQFDVKGTEKNRFKRDYMGKKEAVEDVTGQFYNHDTFLGIIKAMNTPWAYLP